MIRPVIHMALHFIVPGIVAKRGFGEKWKYAWTVMVLTMIVDLDHFLADPIYDPDRCSIGTHLFHTYPALGIYLLMTAFSRTRLIGIGLVIHMSLDWIDCLWMAFE